jgi:D-serine deaminase-like pyridoxal phosphate-dependent protein
MKANELRIGNYVYNGFNEVVRISNIISQNNTSGYLLETLKPIPLTEEILLKCGFVSCKADKDNEWLNLKTRYFNFSSDESVKFKKVYLVLNKTELVCDHLHELQNLYYSLTKTELNYENTISKN